VKRTPLVRNAVKQTTGTATMLGIMLQNLRPADCFQNFIKGDLLLYHLLLRMLRYAKRSGCRLGLDAFNDSLKLRCISLDYRAVRISLPPCLQEAGGHKGRKTFGLRTFLRKRNKKNHRSGVFYFESRRRSACAQGLRRTGRGWRRHRPSRNVCGFAHPVTNTLSPSLYTPFAANRQEAKNYEL